MHNAREYCGVRSQAFLCRGRVCAQSSEALAPWWMFKLCGWLGAWIAEVLMARELQGR